LDGPASHRYYFDPRRNKTRDQMVFTIKMKRKSLFYTFNLIIPTFLISSLTVCVFHLPAGDKNKIILSLSLLFALVVFFLLIGKIIPPTSVVVPLISKYFLLTFILNISSILCTVIVINVYQKETDRFHPWLHYIFVVILPFLLFMEYKTPDFVLIDFNNKKTMYLKSPSIETKDDVAMRNSKKFKKLYYQNEMKNLCNQKIEDFEITDQLKSASKSIQYISNLVKKKAQIQRNKEYWQFIASVIDRLFLIIFFGFTFIGFYLIIIDRD